MNKMYDTTIIRDAVNKKYSQQKDFTEKIAKRFHVTRDAIRHRINGDATPSEEEMILYSKYLKLPLEDIKKCYAKKARQTGFSSARINYDALIEATEKAGYTPHKVCKILNIAYGTYANWKRNGRGKTETIERIAALLNVPADNFYLEEEPEKTETSIDNAAFKSPVASNTDFTEIGDTQNIHDIFEIINKNIINLANIVMNLTDTTESLKQDHVELYKQLMDIKAIQLNADNRVSSPNPEPNKETNTTNPISIAISKEKIYSLICGFDANDSYDDYRHKINDMISIIAANRNATHKQVLHTFYKQMNTVYGVVYDQLKKDYYSKYHRKNNGSMELLYEEPIFREIFYNIISGELQSIQTK